MDNFFYEETNRAKSDVPHIDTELINLQYRAHYHEELELILLLDGELLQTVEGKCVKLTKGDIAFVRPYQIHSYETPKYSKLHTFKIQSPYFDFSTVYLDEPFISPHMPEYELIYQSIQQLVEEHKLKDDTPLKRLALRCATDQLLIRLARLPGMKSITQDSTLAHDRDIELLKTLNDYLAEHYQDNISLEDAASICHMSMYYFAHSFKKATGTTFLNYLNGYRLEQAKLRISDTEESFTSIAMQCGFPSIRTFNRCFQKHYKLTPTEARAKWKSELNM